MFLREAHLNDSDGPDHGTAHSSHNLRDTPRPTHLAVSAPSRRCRRSPPQTPGFVRPFKEVARPQMWAAVDGGGRGPWMRSGSTASEARGGRGNGGQGPRRTRQRQMMPTAERATADETTADEVHGGRGWQQGWQQRRPTADKVNSRRGQRRTRQRRMRPTADGAMTDEATADEVHGGRDPRRTRPTADEVGSRGPRRTMPTADEIGSRGGSLPRWPAADEPHC